MPTYKCRHIQKFVYTMYRDRISGLYKYVGIFGFDN